MKNITKHWTRTEADERAVADGCTFDEPAALKVRKFFRTILKHSKGTDFAGKPFDLLDWQWESVIAPLFGWKRKDGTRRYRRASVWISKKNGKALALDTPLPTPNGWTVMGQVKVGDTLFDENGLPCKVVAATEVMNDRPCYKIEFSDGCVIVADAEHQWKTYARRTCGKQGDVSSGKVMVRTTEEIAQHVRVEWDGSEGYNHSIPVAIALQTDTIDLPIPPYVFGVWLGDGESKSARITCSYSDSELLQHVESCGISVREHKSSNENTGFYLLGSFGRSRRQKSMQTSLRRLGVLGQKWIPNMYLRASVSQRLALLQGLMDTDGYVSKAGQCEFTTTKESLRDGVRELLCSLGYKPTVKTCRATLYGRDIGPKYRIQFWAFDDLPVFRLSRKNARLKKRPDKKARSTTRHIVSARRVPSVPVRCVQVDSPSHLYLAGSSMIPTHNSTLAAGLVLYGLIADGEPGAEIYGAAADRNQAGIIFNEAASMVYQSPALKGQLQVIESTKRIVFPQTRSFYTVLSKDARKTGHGVNGHVMVIDELHVVNQELYDTLRYAGAARRQPLLIEISTAGNDKESLGYDRYLYAKNVFEGKTEDPDLLAYVAEADSNDVWADETQWHKANPSLGCTISMDSFRADWKEASQGSAATKANFCQLRLNIWQDAVHAWLAMDRWDECGAKPDMESLKNRQCYIGLDLASTTDTASLVLLFPGDDGIYDALLYCWVPETACKTRERRNKTLLDNWTRQGLIIKTAGDVIDYDFIRQKILDLDNEYRICQIAVDPWNSTQLVSQLTADGFEVINFRQGFASLTAPSKEFEGLVLTKRLRHGGNPVWRWMAGNCTIETDAAGNIKPSKKTSTEKIDGIIALVMALGIAMQDAVVAQKVTVSAW